MRSGYPHKSGEIIIQGETSYFNADIRDGRHGGDKINIIQKMFERNEDARLMCEIFIVCAFRKKKWRWLWGKYIRKHLDIIAFNELIKFISGSFNANFFLTSITFLTQTKIMTEPKTTPLGQQSEE